MCKCIYLSIPLFSALVHHVYTNEYTNTTIGKWELDSFLPNHKALQNFYF